MSGPRSSLQLDKHLQTLHGERKGRICLQRLHNVRSTDVLSLAIYVGTMERPGVGEQKIKQGKIAIELKVDKEAY